MKLNLVSQILLIVLWTVASTNTPTTNAPTTAAPTTNAPTTTPAVATEITAVTTPTADTTPDVLISVSEAGTIAVGGTDCGLSSSSSVTSGWNTVTLTTNGDKAYDCTITFTDSAGNVGSALSLTQFALGAPTTNAPTTAAPTTNAPGNPSSPVPPACYFGLDPR